MQAKLLRGHPQCTIASITRQVVQLLGKKDAARYFFGSLPLTAEQQALPPPLKGHRRAHTVSNSLSTPLPPAEEQYDGLSVLVTTAPTTRSADLLFSQYKQQNYVELLHHQMKSPLAVSPVFLKTPRRVEALVCLLQVALQAYQVLERLYRQKVQPDETQAEKRLTSESMLRIFGVYGLIVEPTNLGRVIHTTRLSCRQRQILDRPTPPPPPKSSTTCCCRAPPADAAASPAEPSQPGCGI